LENVLPAPLQRIETSTKLPPPVDVVVIGGGVVGTTAAYFLARRGVSVALLEKGVIAGEQSSRNWGWCRQQNRDARELPMATKALELWDRFAREIGEDVGFSRCGLLYLSNREAEIEGWADWCHFARSHNVISHVLTGEQATQRGVATGQSWRGGVFSESDGVADPSRAVPVIARGVLQAGGHLVQQCAVRGVLTTGGRVSGVVTEHGELRCQQVVLAGGAWASSFCHQLGIAFPQASVRASILSVQPGAQGLPDTLHTERASVTSRGDGGYTLAISGRANVDPSWQQLRFASDFVPMFARRWRVLSPGGLHAARAGHESRRQWALDAETPMERNRVLDPAPNQGVLKSTLQCARELLPALQKVDIQAGWASYIDSTPDGVPVIDVSEQLPGFLLAAGFSGHGFGIGPGAGHLIADLVTGADPIVDPSQYRLSRLKASSWGKVADF
jgi:glycine/D-amino acid oxidase-like deaminating enzyme